MSNSKRYCTKSSTIKYIDYPSYVYVCIHNMIILYRLILKEIKTTHKLPFMPLEHSKYITEFRNYPTLIVSKVG